MNRLPWRSDEGGFTLIEMVVAMSILMVVVAVSMSAVVMSTDAVATARQVQDINEEARQALNRVSRDLRQADQLVTAVNADGPGFSGSGIVAVRFQADFDGDECVDGVGSAGCLPYNPANPEDLTYCFDPATSQLYVIDNYGITPITTTSTTCTGGQPLLAGNVSSFQIQYRSNEYRFDSNPADGVTTWREIDAAGLPNGDKNGLLDIELPDMDSLVITMSVSAGGHDQSYRTQVDLRNRSQ